MVPFEPVAVIGMSCLFPRANGLSSYWYNIVRAVDSIGPVPAERWRPEDFRAHSTPDQISCGRGGFLDAIAFDPMLFGVAPNAMEATDTSQLLALAVARRALQDAGKLDIRTGTVAGDRERASVILGVTGAQELAIPLGARLGAPKWRETLIAQGLPPENADAILAQLLAEYVPWQESSFAGLLGNVVAGRVAQRFDCGGTNCVVDAACASSLAAIHLACLELQSRRSDLVISGGVDTFSDPFMFKCFDKTTALSQSEEIRPFCETADGTVLGEGVGVVVLKRLADAEASGDRVYAVIAGIGTASDGRGTAIHAPNAAGQLRALRRAQESAGIEKSLSSGCVGLIEAHATGTRVGDQVELEALEKALAEAPARSVTVGTVKAIIGHTKAAAGVAGLIKAAMSLYHKVLPPAAKIQNPLPALARGGNGPLRLIDEPRPWLRASRELRHAGVSSFGFGGSNYHCILREADDGLVLAQIPATRRAVAELSYPEDLPSCAPVFWQIPWLSRAALTIFDAFAELASCAGGTSLADELAQIEGANQASLMSDLAVISCLSAGTVFLLEQGVAVKDIAVAGERGRSLVQYLYGHGGLDFLLRNHSMLGDDAAVRACMERIAQLLAPVRVAVQNGEDSPLGFPVSELSGCEPVPRTIVVGALATGASASHLENGGYERLALAERENGKIGVLPPALANWLGLHSTRFPRALGDRDGDDCVDNYGSDNEQRFTIPVSGANHRSTAAAPVNDLAIKRQPRQASQAVGMFSHKDQRRGFDVTEFISHDERTPGVAHLRVLERLINQTHELHAQFLVHQAEAQRLVADLAARFDGQETSEGGGLRSGPRRDVGENSYRPHGITSSHSTASYANPAARSGARLEHAPSQATAGERTQKLLEVVSEKTGYPLTMISLSMDMEADLGIDSIKRVELLAAWHELYPRDGVSMEETAHLRTLQDVLDATLGGPTAAAADSSTATSPLPVNGSPTAIGTSTQLATAFGSPLDSRRATTHGTLGIVADLIRVIAEKTGYPQEMIRADMDLEADLGIDSIKRIEILSALMDLLPPGSVAPDPSEMASRRTIQDVADLLRERIAASPNPAAVEELPPIAAGQLGDDRDEGEPLVRLETTVAKAPALGASLNFAPGAVAVVVSTGTEFATSLCAELAASGFDVRHDDGAPASATLAAPGSVRALIFAGPTFMSQDTYMSYYERVLLATQSWGPDLKAASETGPSILVSISHLGGTFALTGNTSRDAALSGGISGFVKTMAHEWRGVRARALDLDADGFRGPGAAAKAAVAALLREGPIELGLRGDDAAFVPLVTVTPLALVEERSTRAPLGEGDLVIISGGARGVTAEAAVQLAAAWKPTIVLLGRTPEPMVEASWLAGLESEAEIKRAISLNIPSANSPLAVEREFKGILAGRAVATTMRRIRAVGSPVIYRHVDIRDRLAVATTLESIRATLGPVRAIVHGAGIIADALVEAKGVEEFRAVVSTKVDGFLNLLAAVADDPVRLIAVFSSSTARYGRVGQTDYAVANEILNKLAQAEAVARPECRVLACNWGPWDGGMVTAQLRGMFEREGIGIIALAAGAKHFVREVLAAQPRAASAIAASRMGAHGVQNATEFQHSVEVVVLGPAPKRQGGTAAVSGDDNFDRIHSRSVTLARYPIMEHHVFGGRAMVPAALMVEWMTHAARAAWQGLDVRQVSNFRVFRGIAAAHDTLVHIVVGTPSPAPTRAPSHGIVVPVEVVNANETQNGLPVVHARALLHFGDSIDDVAAPKDLTQLIGPHDRRTLTPPLPLYDGGGILFHGPHLQPLGELLRNDTSGVTMIVAAAPPPNVWQAELAPETWWGDPMLLDGAFQMAVLWSRTHLGIPCLPVAAQRIIRSSAHGVNTVVPENCSWIVDLNVQRQTASSLTADIHIARVDGAGDLLMRVIGYEAVLDSSLADAFARRTLEAR